MYFKKTVEDNNQECSVGSEEVDDVNTDECRCFCPNDDLCIFPFYYNGRLIDQCAYLEYEGYLVQGPIYRCPIRNITRKINGINSFLDRDLIQQVGDFKYPSTFKKYVYILSYYSSTILVCV